MVARRVHHELLSSSSCCTRSRWIVVINSTSRAQQAPQALFRLFDGLVFRVHGPADAQVRSTTFGTSRASMMVMNCSGKRWASIVT